MPPLLAEPLGPARVVGIGEPPPLSDQGVQLGFKRLGRCREGRSLQLGRLVPERQGLLQHRRQLAGECTAPRVFSRASWASSPRKGAKHFCWSPSASAWGSSARKPSATKTPAIGKDVRTLESRLIPGRSKQEETKKLCPDDELAGKLEPLPEAELGFGVAVTHADLYVLTGQLKEAIRKKAGLGGTLFTVP
ncbi:MAG: hypothetical protein ACK4Z6_04475 [Candidatus Methylomirabilales bacterium]